MPATGVRINYLPDWLPKTDRFFSWKPGFPTNVKMNSLKQVIVNAVVKVSTDPVYKGREYETPEEARLDFIKALIAELFPECPECVLPSTVQVSEADGGGPKAEPEKPKKKRAPKAEAPAAAGAAAEAPVEKKKAGRKPKAEAPAAAGAAAETPVEKKKGGRKPKAVAEGDLNLPKWNPSDTNRFKAIAKEMKVDVDKKAFQDYVNAMSKEEFNTKTLDEHIREHLSSRARNDIVHDLTKCARVEWQGTEYLVDPVTKKVYRPDGDVNTHVGHVGMLEFDGLEIPSA